jgi:hypothetical protein
MAGMLITTFTKERRMECRLLPRLSGTPAAPPEAPQLPPSLAATFARVPDSRRAASITYPLATLLSLAVDAFLADHTSVLTIAEWGARHRPNLLARLGCRDDRAPCQSTLHRLCPRRWR